MKQETQLRTVALATGVVAIFRTVDFDAIMSRAVDGKISVEDLQSGGTYLARFFPKKKGDTQDFPLASLEAADAFVAGFAAATSTQKRGGRKSTVPALPDDLNTITKDYDLSVHNKAQMETVAKHFAVEYKQQMKKSEIAKQIVAKLSANAAATPAKAAKRGAATA